MRHVFYPAILDREGEQALLSVPDLGIVKLAVPTNFDPYQFAIDQAHVAVEGLRKRARRVEPPSPLTSFQGRTPAPEALFQVPVATYRRYVRVGFNMDPVLLQRVDAAADERSMTRSAFLSMAASSALMHGFQAA